MEKKCPKCNKLKPRSAFAKASKRKDGLQSVCRGCQSELYRKSYSVNHAKYAERKRVRYNENQQWLFAYLRTHPCVDCGETDIVVLDFDHVDTKVDNVTDLLRSRAAMTREIERCEVRCANCHRRATARRAGWPRWAVGELADPSDFGSER